MPNFLRDLKEDDSVIRRRVLRCVLDRTRIFLKHVDCRYIKRPDMKEEIRRCIVEPMQAVFYIITGARGIGKRTAVRKVVQELVQDGHPIVYLSLEGNSLKKESRDWPRIRNTNFASCS